MKQIKEFFGTVPHKAILCSMTMAPHFLEQLKLEKVAIIKTVLTPNQKLPFIYQAEYKGQKVLVVDTLQENEDKYPEFYPILPIRTLVLSGVQQFYIITESFGVDPTLKVGEAFLFENFVPVNAINPFIGRHIKEWGDRFLDISFIFSHENIELIKKALGSEMKLATHNVMWTNPIKTFADAAELRIAQSLRLTGVVNKGMVQAFTLHDMKKPFVAIGIVQKNLHDEKEIQESERKEVAKKLINILGVELKGIEKKEEHH